MCTSYSLGAINQLCICIGILLGYVACKFLDQNWRALFYLASPLAALLGLAFAFVTPYSPRWLLTKGREDEARVILQVGRLIRVHYFSCPNLRTLPAAYPRACCDSSGGGGSGDSGHQRHPRHRTLDDHVDSAAAAARALEHRHRDHARIFPAGMNVL